METFDIRRLEEDWEKRTGDGSSDEDLDRQNHKAFPNSLTPLDFPQKLICSQAHQVSLSNFQSNRGYTV